MREGKRVYIERKEGLQTNEGLQVIEDDMAVNFGDGHSVTVNREAHTGVLR